ncbi:MAG: tRNA adenosine(34) deaminase TadA [Proteobacteria bacterium]|nr:tRNA adenosine(34) deaminase TadA [Pseudomonadota bacterium]
MIDDQYMALAIQEAEKAGQNNEVPIGSLIVAKSGEVLSKAGNMTITQSDPTAHAEMLAIRKAAYFIGNYRLTGATLYTTIEPCIMCMGAIVHARLERVVFGADDPKWGGAGSLYNFADDPRLNHRVELISGVLGEECRALIQDFFRNKRGK